MRRVLAEHLSCGSCNDPAHIVGAAYTHKGKVIGPVCHDCMIAMAKMGIFVVGTPIYMPYADDALARVLIPR